jgi:hypothetical protein
MGCSHIKFFYTRLRLWLNTGRGGGDADVGNIFILNKNIDDSVTFLWRGGQHNNFGRNLFLLFLLIKCIKILDNQSFSQKKIGTLNGSFSSCCVSILLHRICTVVMTQGFCQFHALLHPELQCEPTAFQASVLPAHLVHSHN